MASYIREIADEIRAQVDPAVELTPESLPVFLIYAVLLRARGAEVTPALVHDAWVAWREISGEDSPFLVEFDALDASTQRRDDPFVRAIEAVASNHPVR